MKVGLLVNHRIFGKGVITKVFDTFCEVKFENLPTKRLVRNGFIEIL